MFHAATLHAIDLMTLGALPAFAAGYLTCAVRRLIRHAPAGKREEK